MILLYVVIAIILFFSTFWIRNRWIQAKQRNDLKKVFESPNISLPTIKFGSTYYWPTFEITFSTKEDYEFAVQNKLLEKFNVLLKSYYDSEFNPDLAVRYKYLGSKL